MVATETVTKHWPQTTFADKVGFVGRPDCVTK